MTAEEIDPEAMAIAREAENESVPSAVVAIAIENLVKRRVRAAEREALLKIAGMCRKSHEAGTAASLAHVAEMCEWFASPLIDPPENGIAVKSLGHSDTKDATPEKQPICGAPSIADPPASAPILEQAPDNQPQPNDQSSTSESAPVPQTTVEPSSGLNKKPLPAPEPSKEVLFCECGDGRSSHHYDEDLGHDRCSWSDCDCQAFRPASVPKEPDKGYGIDPSIFGAWKAAEEHDLRDEALAKAYDAMWVLVDWHDGGRELGITEEGLTEDVYRLLVDARDAIRAARGPQ